MADLDSRKQSILRAIIVEYVEAAEPVGSEALVHKYDLGVKSATVRNEMAEMLDLGYLEQPHTSAGRIPSDLGYRYYVDRLIVERPLTESATARVQSASTQSDALHTVLRDTVRALSRVTQLLGVATTVRDIEVSVRTAVLSALGPRQALLVLVLSNGHVENRMIEMPVGLSLDDIGKANELIASQMTGKTLRSLSKLKLAASPGLEKLFNTLSTTIRSLSQDLTRGTIITEGEEFMFGQPEFQRDVGYLAELLHELTESQVLYESVTPKEGTKTVTIGRENRHEQMRQLSIVRRSFYVGDNEAGVIALVGPTRMKYDTSIPLINFTAAALSTSLSRYFG